MAKEPEGTGYYMQRQAKGSVSHVMTKLNPRKESGNGRLGDGSGTMGSKAGSKRSNSNYGKNL